MDNKNIERRASALGVLVRHQHTEPHAAITRLLQVEMAILREKNDTAKPEQVLQNQGAISQMKKLLRDIMPVDRREELQTYSGAPS